MGFSWGSQRTIRGFALGEVSSAFQKSVRRGEEQQAVFWALEMSQSGQAQYVWNRIMVIVSEDIGIAEPGVATDVRALYDNWKDTIKRKPPGFSERLMLIHATLIIVRARKSRLVDNIHWSICSVEEPLFDEIPDYALDAHTARGRRMGRTGKPEDKAISYHLENGIGDEDNWAYQRKEAIGYQDGWHKAQQGRDARAQEPPRTTPVDGAPIEDGFDFDG